MSSTNPFANLFGKSPFKALQDHMRVVLECAREIPPLFESLAAGDQGGSGRQREDLREGSRGRQNQE